MRKYKLIVFAPDEQKVIKTIIDSAAEKGAGTIGKYTHCAFIQKGAGSFIPQEGSNPTIGKVGERSEVTEARIEMECPANKTKAVLKSIRKVHPYEEPAIDIYPLISEKEL